jgi:ParB family transcriptional regulator, chromosome partitioning protein
MSETQKQWKHQEPDPRRSIIKKPEPPAFPRIVPLPSEQLREAPWNPNAMDPILLAKLKHSVERFGLVGVLVVRPLGNGLFQVLSGNQRLQVLRDLGWDPIPCVVVEADEAEAKLLAQTLNQLHGSDDLGLKADLISHILKAIPREEVLSLLPETAERLQGLSHLNAQTITQSLAQWQESQKARLKHFTCQLTQDQLATVETALKRFNNQARTLSSDNPNPKGASLYLLAQKYLEMEEK